METKKSIEANNEKLRLPLQLVSFLFVGGIVLGTFSFNSPINDENESDKSIRSNNIIQERIEAPKKEDKPIEIKETKIVVIPPTELTKTKVNDNDTTVEQAVVVPFFVEKQKIKVNEIVIEEIDQFPDKEASFQGGYIEMQKWIFKNFVYPPTSLEIGEQGKVYLEFIVEKDGSITDVNIKQGVSEDLDREAKRLIRLMPNWLPGETKGKKVRTRCRLPINFQID